MARSSVVFHRIVLILAAVGALGVAAWVGIRLFEPIAIPPIPPPKVRVTFDPRADIRKNPLFATLRGLTQLRREIEPGRLGRDNPFEALSGAGGVVKPGESIFGTVEEVALNGARAIAISRARDGAMLALVDTGDGTTVSYEVRRFSANQDTTTVARWKLEGISESNIPADALIPVAFQQDGLGGMRFLSRAGHLGVLQPTGVPVWGSTPLFTDAVTDQTIRSSALIVDGSGRVWVTNGKMVVRETDAGFSVVDLQSVLTADQRAALSSSIDDWKLQALQDGSVVVYSSKVAEFFPMGGGDASRAIFSSGAFIAISVSGDAWSAVQKGGSATEWVRQTITNETQEFTDPVTLPKQGISNPGTLANGLDTLYGFDYSMDVTMMWRFVNGSWTTEILTGSGTMPKDATDRIAVDGQGNVWAILGQKGLLLARTAR